MEEEVCVYLSVCLSVCEREYEVNEISKSSYPLTQLHMEALMREQEQQRCALADRIRYLEEENERLRRFY